MKKVQKRSLQIILSVVWLVITIWLANNGAFAFAGALSVIVWIFALVIGLGFIVFIVRRL